MKSLAKRMRLGERGVIFIMLTLSLIMILPLVGLAFDCGMLYLTRTKLSAAVDAAVLAGARSLNRGLDLDSQRDSAEATAIEFFNANFPAGTLASSNTTFEIDVTQTGTRTRVVTMTASTDAPLYFLRALHQDWTTLRVGAQASRRDVNLILLMDRSGSIASAGAENQVRGSAKIFVDKFAEGRDRLGMVSFSGPYYVDFPYGMDFKTRTPTDLFEAIDALNFDGNTGTAQALWQGYQQIVTINEVGALNVIVFFTDGRPTALTADFPVKTNPPLSTCTSTTAKFGFISAPIGSYPPTGTTWGVMKTNATSTTHYEWTVAPDSSGCYYNSGSGSDLEKRARMRQDIAYIPDTDRNNINIRTGYLSPDLYTTAPYAGKVRVDSPRALRYAANNLADNTATRIRTDATLTPFIYTLGLGGTSSEPIDHDLLRRIANDPASPTYTSTQPTGIYVYAPTTAQLTDAFVKIASEILRLTK